MALRVVHLFVDADLIQSEQGRLVKSSLQNTEGALITAANEPSLALYRIQVII